MPGHDDPIQTQFRAELARGNEAECNAIVDGEMEKGHAASEVAIRFIADAMHGIGMAWQSETLDVYQERLACGICQRMISRLRESQSAAIENAPRAIGGAPEGDFYELPTALVELALRDHGWNATNLGCNLPFSGFQQAAHDHQPALLWISVSARVPDQAKFVLQQRELAASLGDRTALILGGQSLDDQIRPMLVYTAHCDTIPQLVDLVSLLKISPNA